MHTRGVIALLALLVTLAVPPAGAQACGPGPTALVLSGGGAKGLAHIGVLLSLDSLGIRPDLIVGTSMGAIIGAMYASGMSARQIDSTTRALPLTGLFESTRPRAPVAWGGRLPVALWAQGDRGFALQAPAVDEAQANAILNAAMLRGNLLARGNFDSLPIPFRAVSTDLQAWRPQVLGEGDLAQAVRASIALPIVFSPERVAGRVLVDGGLTANVPMEVARGFGVARVIVVDVTERRGEADSLPGEAPLQVVDRLFGVLFEQSLAELGPDDLLIRPLVQGYRNLDFTPARVAELVALGREAAEAALAGFSCRPLPGPRPAFPLPRRLSGLHSARVEETPLLQRLLGLSVAQELDEPALARTILGLRHSDLYRSIWLHPEGNRDSVQLVPVVRRLPRRTAGIGFAYDNDLGGQVWLGATERRGRGGDIEWSGVLSLARFEQEFELGARLFTGLTRYALTPAATLRVSNRVIRKFEVPGVEDTRDEVAEARLFVGLERPFFNSWLVRAGAEPVAWREPGAAGRTALGGRLVVLRRREPEARRVFADLEWNTAWWRSEAEVAVRMSDRRLVVEPRLRAAWGRDLPVHRTFVFGGDDGFPGLNRHELRGDREVLASLQSSYHLDGPVSVRLLLAGGRTARGGPLIADDGWLAGVRAGLGVDSPLGPIHFEYGWGSGRRRAAWVRIGRWF